MKNLNILLLDQKNINVCNTLRHYSAGKFRFISKCRAGFLTVSDSRENENNWFMENPEKLITGFKKGALQTVQFQPEGTDYWLTIFAKNGKKIPVIDERILSDLTVGSINSYWLNTALYNQHQYMAVGAKTWADKAFIVKDLETIPVLV